MDNEYTLKPQIFTLGAQGPKGERLFFFQSIDPKTLEPMSLKCEKSQVVAVVRVLELLLETLPVENNIPLEDLEPEAIGEIPLAWVVGDLNIYYSWERDEIELQVSKLALPDDLEEPMPDIEESETIKFLLTRKQADGFLRMAQKLIQMGRPTCQFCLMPLNHTPESNFCPCWN